MASFISFLLDSSGLTIRHIYDNFLDASFLGNSSRCFLTIPVSMMTSSPIDWSSCNAFRLLDFLISSATAKYLPASIYCDKHAVFLSGIAPTTVLERHCCQCYFLSSIFHFRLEAACPQPDDKPRPTIASK